MATSNINPTRMELTRLKKRLVTARRGHKLLKDKRDELMRQFLDAVRENKRLRREVEEKLMEANSHMAISRSLMQSEALDISMLYRKQELTLDVSEKNIMSVRVPRYSPKYKSADQSAVMVYGFAFTSFDLDDAMIALSDITEDLIRLAEIEKSCSLMAAEIEKTRRRVNALEHVMIPDYVETIRYITMKLDESERSATTRLMKVKDMMLEKNRLERIQHDQEAELSAPEE
ncbi:MAG TPA: V-type ATP synthase subunit D [Bacillota bacterium]|nr:V-type ATP synthase subunit D [Bacillota bacterium]